MSKIRKGSIPLAIQRAIREAYTRSGEKHPACCECGEIIEPDQTRLHHVVPLRTLAILAKADPEMRALPKKEFRQAFEELMVYDLASEGGNLVPVHAECHLNMHRQRDDFAVVGTENDRVAPKQLESLRKSGIVSRPLADIIEADLVDEPSRAEPPPPSLNVSKKSPQKAQERTRWEQFVAKLREREQKIHAEVAAKKR